MKFATLIYGNQLFDKHPALSSIQDPVIMIEAYSICSNYRYHKHKLILILAAMREYRDKLRKRGYTVYYVELTRETHFFPELKNIIDREKITHLKVVTPVDRTAEKNLHEFITKHSLSLKEYDGPAFLTPRYLSNEWFSQNKHPLMEYFYRWQRRRLGILMQGDKPEGGGWNFDAQNRQPIPKLKLDIPKVLFPPPTTHVREVSLLINSLFSNNPGETRNFWLPVKREDALIWLKQFIEERLPLFGTYEDAMVKGEAFLFHSVLSPMLNIGLLTPEEVLKEVLNAFKKNQIPINSVEGFVRQIIGWREYMRGVYWYKDKFLETNYFGFNKELEDWWYTNDFRDKGLPIPIIEALTTLHSYGYNHHIERLMIFGNWFLLNEYNPKSVLRWFMSMYVDAYEWVMVPNVIGMSQYADGGFVATKPYISGGNYLEKMGRWWGSTKAAKDSAFTKKYWEFLYRNREKLRGNPRLGIALKQAEKIFPLLTR